MKGLLKKSNNHGTLCFLLAVVMIGAVCAPSRGWADPLCKNGEYTTDFRLDACTFSSVGSNEYFILEPGYKLIYQGEEKDEVVDLEITVLNDTEMVGGTETRVVEEKEWADGELVEVSRNFFAICVETNSVFYFGEDVDIYEDGEVVSHEGAWRAYEGNNEPGLMMPGIIVLGARYFQEIAPDVAMDKATILEMDVEVEVPAGVFGDCLITLETSGIEAQSKDYKVYAPGVGLIIDPPVELVDIVLP